ncbi:helix-turn-helix domain-containing protein [Nocardia puris]|nr:helix-turn-helix transcriptional regulator [Nocardia puris]
MDPIDRSTADAVLLAIRQAGQTQKAVRVAVGIPPTTWRNRVRGIRSFRAHELVRIARHLHIPPGRFLDDLVESVR